MNTLRRIVAAIARFLESVNADRHVIPPAPLALPPADVPVLIATPDAPDRSPRGLDLVVVPPAPAGPPYFIADFSHWDGDVDVDAYVADRRYIGVWVKLTQGAGGYAHEAYGRALIARFIAAARKAGRLGVDFWIGAYGYVNFDEPGGAQATYLFRACRAAGLLDIPAGSRLRAMMDVERGSSGSANYNDNGAKVTACAEAFARTWLALTGTKAIAYGRGAWRDLKLRGLLGCDGVVNPAYTSDMPSMDGYGVPRSEIVAQQYTDGQTNRSTFPTLPPGAHAADTSVILGAARGQLAGLETARRRLVWAAL